MAFWLFCAVQVVPDKIGGQSSSYNDFVCSLPDGQCRYAGEHCCTALHCCWPLLLPPCMSNLMKPPPVTAAPELHHNATIAWLMPLQRAHATACNPRLPATAAAAAAVYDYEYRSPERGATKKMVFLLW